MADRPHRRFPALPLLFALAAFSGNTQSNTEINVETDPGETFGDCIARLQQQARSQGLSQHTVDEVLGQVSHSERVIELDRRQPEFAETFTNYLNKRVTDTRIERGRELLAKHQKLLLNLQQSYGIQAHYLLAFWGLETNFGSYIGTLPVLDSLATLACDPRRGDYFASELMNALRIVDSGIAPERMVGSWAGAMGQTQFMPSVYLRYARDGDGDGIIDLWGSSADALTSAAAFLQDLGWQAGWRWGREVVLPEDFPFLESGSKHRLPLSAWRERKVLTTSGAQLPALDVATAIVVPAGHRGPAFAVYDNFDVIMRWNRSEYYAIAVGHLADRISGAGKLHQAPPTDAPRLSQEQIAPMQTTLNEGGFNAGKADGVLGPGTRAAIQRYQQAEGMIPDSYPDDRVLAGLGVPRN